MQHFLSWEENKFHIVSGSPVPPSSAPPLIGNNFCACKTLRTTGLIAMKYQQQQLLTVQINT